MVSDNFLQFVPRFVLAVSLCMLCISHHSVALHFCLTLLYCFRVYSVHNNSSLCHFSSSSNSQLPSCLSCGVHLVYFLALVLLSFSFCFSVGRIVSSLASLASSLVHYIVVHTHTHTHTHIHIALHCKVCNCCKLEPKLMAPKCHQSVYVCCLLSCVCQS